MTQKELKEQLNMVLSALDGMPVTGRVTVKNMSACMQILEYILAADIVADECKEDAE